MDKYRHNATVRDTRRRHHACQVSPARRRKPSLVEPLLLISGRLVGPIELTALSMMRSDVGRGSLLRRHRGGIMRPLRVH